WATFDSVINQHLKLGAKNTIYTHHQLHDEILDIVSNMTVDKLINQVKHARIFSIIMDETPNISMKEKLSMLFRHVDMNGEVQESLVGLQTATNTTGKHLFNQLCCFLSKKGLSVEMICGQSYDGGSNMSRKVKGVKSHILEMNPKGLYVHCSGHVLNLCIMNVTSWNRITEDYFVSINELYKLIENSPKRKYIFEEEQKSFDKKSRPRLLQSLSQTSQKMSLVKTLERTISEDTDGQSRTRARVTDILHDILQLLSACLQAPQLDLVAVKKLVILTKSKLSAMRDESKFKEYFKTASKHANELKIPVISTAPSSKDTRRGELAEMTPEVYFRIQFYYPVLVTEFSQCFGNVDTLEAFTALSKVLQRIPKNTSSDQNDIDPTTFVTEYCVSCEYYFKIGSKVENNLTDVVKLLTKQGLESSFPNVTVMYKIAVTLPVTSAGVEHTFSKLKLIKMRLHSTMGDKRLQTLIIISIERNSLDSIEVSDIIDKFAEQENHRIRFR
uniref:DUF4371 domain-containing protein n=1 Tax=Latimeria chalumnae TaxID=7897 RepID=H3A5I6_LATCH